MKKEILTKQNSISIFCTFITVVVLVWSFLDETINSYESIFARVFFLLLFGIGGIGLATIVCEKLSSVLKKLNKREKKK